MAESRRSKLSKTETIFFGVGATLVVLGAYYEFTERLTDFSDETKRNADKLPKA